MKENKDELSPRELRLKCENDVLRAKIKAEYAKQKALDARLREALIHQHLCTFTGDDRRLINDFLDEKGDCGKENG
jgi:hypothetical protein